MRHKIPTALHVLPSGRYGRQDSKEDDMDRKPTVLLEAWQLVASGGLLPRLKGFATGHPQLPGFRRHIVTSHVVRVDPAQREAETLNSIYRLRRRLSSDGFDRDGPTRLSLCHLSAERRPDQGDWSVRDHRRFLAVNVPDDATVILAMLVALDLEGFDDTKI
jgi:hypothetical protein